MPLPVLAGIPWLAGLIGGLFSSLFTFFATYVTKRLAIVASVVVIITALTVGFFTAMQALAAGLIGVVPPELSQGAALLLPGNIDECMTVIVSAKLLRWAYDWNVRIIQYKLL